jgi:CMP-N,N'-diacetyllegionaminic acid synthase
MTPRVLFLIVARGGSKGLPRKNLRTVGGLSLIGYKARAATRSSHCARLVISSEDAEMLAEGRKHGAEAPFVRPAELATDTASTDDVVLHAMEVVEAEEGAAYDAVMLLEPSSPFATPEDLDDAVELYMQRGASLVVGVRQVTVGSRFIGPLRSDGRADQIVSKFAGSRSRRRQDVGPEYTMNGALYLASWAMLRRSRQIYGDPENTFGLVMDEDHSLDIESPHDLAFAEFLVASGKLDTTRWRD